MQISSLPCDPRTAHIDLLFPQSRKDTAGTPGDGSILAFQDESNRTGLCSVYGESIPRKQGNDDARSPLCTLSVSSNDTFHQSVSYPILDGCSIYYRRGDEKLVLNVDEMLRELNSCESLLSVLGL